MTRWRGVAALVMLAIMLAMVSAEKEGVEHVEQGGERADMAGPECRQEDWERAMSLLTLQGGVGLRKEFGEDSPCWRRKGSGGQTLLHAAASRGLERSVRDLVELGTEIDSVDDMGRTPLMNAAWESHPAVVKALLELGANATMENAGGGTALTVAMRRKRPASSDKHGDAAEVVRLLRQRVEMKGAYRGYQWHRDADWKWHDRRSNRTEKEEI
eukprot:756308-Hanusia_phi.AAC.4